MGAIIFKTHHCFTDGLGASTLFLALSGNYDHNALPGVKPLSLFQNCAVTILYPYLVLKTTIQMLLTFRSFNAIKTSVPMTGIKNGAYSTDFNLEEIKLALKKKTCSLNDYMMAVLSNTLYEYFENHKSEDGGRIPKSINIGMPFSLRQPSKTLKDIKTVNDFITVPITIPINKELEDVLPNIKSQYKALKTSLDPFGFLYSFSLVV